MLSAVIITKNEEKNIEKCIDALIDWVDEIIIADSNSTDNTINILKNFNSSKIKIHQVTWLGFAKTKNQAIESAKGDWILSIDADEIVTAELKNEILNKIASPNNSDGYYIPRLLFFCGKPVKYGGTYPDYQLRLFKKNKGEFEDIPVHESVKINGKTQKIKNHLLHFSYNTMFEYWERFNKYTELDAQKKLQQGKKFTFNKIFILHFELFKRLIIKRGLLDGFPGIFYHVFSAVSSLVKYAKLWELQK